MDAELIKIVALSISFVGLLITLYKVNRNSITRSNKAASDSTRINLKIIEIEKDILGMKQERTKLVTEMKTQREKDIVTFAELVNTIDLRHTKMMAEFRNDYREDQMDNRESHTDLFKLNREQTQIMSTMSAGIARIEGADSKK